MLRNQPPPFSKEVRKTLFEKEGGSIAIAIETGDLGETNSNFEFVSTNPPALRATSFFKVGLEQLK
ncbi:MAG: hypothetical protein A3D15_02190 [Alphaproteobacteria bacterium RIFCSPHIGHO2_02_FULL_40_34]|nr:MAG: hypothetical protein A3D15_02190 [Alphaproteobacteria bacterium RIFCSPHIGHO2_02_FULL_40_34]